MSIPRIEYVDIVKMRCQDARETSAEPNREAEIRENMALAASKAAPGEGEAERAK